mgnify:CR=1 FL=1
MNIKKLASLLFQRSVIVALLIFLQAAMLLLYMLWFSSDFIYVYWGCVVLSILAVLIIVSRQTDPGYKIAWIIPILLFPAFGWLVYLLCGGNKLSARKRRKMQGMDRTMLEQLERDYKAEELRPFGADAVNQARYLEHYARCPVYTNTYTHYFPLGDDVFPAMLEELRKAEKYIFLEYFIISPGIFWDSMVEILKEKHAAGVDVRVIYDDVGSLNTLPMNYARKFETETGIPCCCFNRFKPVISIRMNNRDHRKFCIIDGHTAFTGGINLADEYINQKERFGHWKDTAIMLKGDAVNSFLMMFLQIWNITEQKPEDYRKYQLDPGYQFPPELDRKGYVMPYGDSPLDEETVGQHVYMDILNESRYYVHIMTPYLILDSDMITALTFAAKRGIEVIIIMPHIPDKIYAYVLARSYYEELLLAGVRIFEYTPGFIHAKVFTSDDTKAVVGSINLDYRSLHLHFECAAYLFRNQAVAQAEADFQDTLKKSQEITVEDCRNYPLGRRMAGKMLRLIAPLM